MTSPQSLPMPSAALTAPATGLRWIAAHRQVIGAHEHGDEIAGRQFGALRSPRLRTRERVPDRGARHARYRSPLGVRPEVGSLVAGAVHRRAAAGRPARTGSPASAVAAPEVPGCRCCAGAAASGPGICKRAVDVYDAHRGRAAGCCLRRLGLRLHGGVEQPAPLALVHLQLLRRHRRRPVARDVLPRSGRSQARAAERCPSQR